LREQQTGGATDQLGLFSRSLLNSPLTAKGLAEAFGAHANLPFAPDYANRLAQIDFSALSGFLRGFIDLVFEHDGRWYVVDYKSNRLGRTPQDYAPDRLPPVMMSHHYVLQYHLYVVALHRYLNQRLPRYDYERHFGGVYYLFLRGMAPRYARGNGVYYDRPPRRLIERLTSLLDGAGGRR
ncbi:MAG TPA: PD-(D/E)XK nuclease family protein, partial [Candidatus Acidoferrales bacterium]|nr:PD-(D/E)XK nuclease family protein [Candidatus Acidoferrales bacterium]